MIVLKRGGVVGSMPTSATSPEEIARLMVGRDVLPRWKKREQRIWRASLCFRSQESGHREVAPGVKFPRSISFAIRAGEILGIAGVEGNGQSELVKGPFWPDGGCGRNSPVGRPRYHQQMA